MATLKRNSNIELLRCVLMLMLLVLHFNGQIIFTSKSIEEYLISPMAKGLQYFVSSIAIIVVNCFVLISGYFGIKNVIRKITSLYIICFFYAFIYFLFITFRTSHIDGREIVEFLFCLSNSKLWFITSYVALLLFAPILNVVINNITRKQHLAFIFLLTVYNIYILWFWKMEIAGEGHNVLNFIYLYFIGRYLNIYKVKMNMKWSWIVYILFSLIIMFLIIFCLYTNQGKHIYLHVLVYNSPFVIISSIAFFMIFLNLKIESSIVNWIASSSIAVYIVHWTFWKQIKEYLLSVYETSSISKFIIVCTGWVILLYVVSILIDKIRIKISNPLENKIINLVEKKVNLLIDKI